MQTSMNGDRRNMQNIKEIFVHLRTCANLKELKLYGHRFRHFSRIGLPAQMAVAGAAAGTHIIVIFSAKMFAPAPERWNHARQAVWRWRGRPTILDPLHRYFEQSFAQSRPVTIADRAQPDVPLIYANAAFEEMTGYSGDEILGRNCRFLQGPESSKLAVARLRMAIEERVSATVVLSNYRKSGERFINALSMHCAQVPNAGRDLVFGFQFEVPAHGLNHPDETAPLQDEMDAMVLLEDAYYRDFLKAMDDRARQMRGVLETIVVLYG